MAASLISPMLAMLGKLPGAAGWATEFKWDGVRTVTYLDDRGVTAMSRNDLDVSTQYPELAGLAGLVSTKPAVLDGEIVALKDGVPEFALLQNRMHVKTPSSALLTSIPITYYVFDVLVLDGKSTIGLPYTQRRELLESLDLNSGVVQTPPAFIEAEPADIYQSALDNGLEGVVCKRLTSSYHPARRSPDWTKVPIARTQEAIIVGWQGGAGRRAGLIGSLLLAAHDSAGELTYIGKVGTGFTDAMLRDLAADLAPLDRSTPPVSDIPRADARNAHWVRPDLVGEVAFRTWTPDGRLRHPSWRGLRPDKTPADVVRAAASG